MPEIILLLESILIVFIIYIFLEWIIPNKHKTYAKGPFGFPIVGHLPLFGKLPTLTFLRWWKTYGDVFSIRMGSWNTVVVNGYRAVRATAEHVGDAFSGRPNFVSMQLLEESCNEARLVVSNFSQDYLKQRKLTSKSLRIFKIKRLEVIEELVSNEAILLTEILIRKYEKSPGNITFDVQTFVVRIMYQFLYGRGNPVDIERHVKVIMKCIEEVNEFTLFGSVIDSMPWLRYTMPWKIDEVKKMIAKTDTVMLEQIHEHYETFSKDEIRDVADAILSSDADDEKNQDRYVLTRTRLNTILGDLQGAGSNTTHKTLVWLFLYMSAFPHVQAKVHAELDDIVGKGRKVQLNDKPNLVYTNAVIYEVMRIVTQLPFAVPHYAIKDGEIEGIHVDKGTVVILNLYSVHHEKDFWGDPECFRPERFILDNNTLDKDKCNHILPFGVGRRRCVGEFLAKMSVFLSFAIVMQTCMFVAPMGDPLDLSPIPGLVYSPKDFKVRVVPRN